MATKKHLRNLDLKQRKNKRSKKKLYLYLTAVLVIAILFLFFLTIFDHVYQPVNKDMTRKREKQMVTLYFADHNERFLLPEIRYVTKEAEPLGLAREIVMALLDGSKTDKVNTFPPNVSLLNISIDKDTAIVSFDELLVKMHPGGTTSEMTTIYSLTNSLIANIPKIQRVKILVEGRELESIAGHIDTRHSFAFNKEFIAPVTSEGKK